MKTPLALVVLCLTGCVLPTESNDPIQRNDVITKTPEQGIAPGIPGGLANSCGSFEEEALQGPDGSLIIIRLPLPCDPFWYDMGDPAPDTKKEHDNMDPQNYEMGEKAH